MRNIPHIQTTATAFRLKLLGAFLVGGMASPVMLHLVADVHAESAGSTFTRLAPAMIDLVALKHTDLSATSNPELNAQGLVSTENATVGIQSGNIAKHQHPRTDEIQYIIEGSGAMWLGTERREFKPGTLIVIPKGTPHAGTLVTSGPVKALVIKIPPQPKDDTVFVD